MSRSALPQNYNRNSGIQIDSCDSLTGWSSTGSAGQVMSLDQVHVMEGSGSIKGSITNGSVILLKQITQGLFNSETVFSFWAYLAQTNIEVNSLYLQFSSVSNFASNFSFRFTFAYLGNGETWKRLHVHASAMTNTGSEDWAQVQYVRFIATGNAGKSIDVSFDDLRYGVDNSFRLMITFDDGYTNDLGDGDSKTAADYMVERGAFPTLYISPAGVGAANHFTLSQLQALYAQGASIAGHSNNHDPWAASTLTTQAEYESAIRGSHDYLITNGMPSSAKHFCYPGGVFNSAALAAMRSLGMLTGRTTKEVEQPVPFGDSLQLNSRVIYNTTTLSDVMGWINTAIKNQSHLFLCVHAIVVSPSTSLQWSSANFKALIDYVTAMKITCATIERWYKGLTSYRTPV